jgi:predicted metal-dependent hydrolase
VAPPGASPALIQRFIGEHRQWIDRRVREFSAHTVDHTERPTLLRLPAIDASYAVDYHGARGPVRISRPAHNRIKLSGNGHNPRAVAHALRRWLMGVAQLELGKRIAELAFGLDMPIERVQVRCQRTRWGSCSATGTISLNVCLLFLDPTIVRYLFLHELCHTRHMNHSARFWSLVASFEPDYRRLDRELTHGWQHVPAWMFL